MNPRVKTVEPQPDYLLKLTFTNGEVRAFDVKPHLDTGIFQEPRDVEMFNTVRPALGSIQWKNEADLCPDTLYERPGMLSKPAGIREVVEQLSAYLARGGTHSPASARADKTDSHAAGRFTVLHLGKGRLILDSQSPDTAGYTDGQFALWHTAFLAQLRGALPDR